MILATIRRGEHIQHHESIRRRKDGSLLNVSITASPVLSATGQIIGASKIEHDITVSKMAEGALIRSEKLAAAGRLAATLAHEINNPLQAVTNLVSLWRQSPNDEQSERYATMVDEELRRVNHLTQQSLNFYRESAAPSSIDLAAIIRSVLEVYAKRLSAKRIHLTAAYSQGETTVTSYPGEVRQVFSTLLVNALEAVPDGGKISVRVRKAHHRNDPECNGVLIMIADNGVGVPRNSLGRIFEPFYTTKLETGTGLGLWVANGIVSRLGGSIRVRSSVQPGKSGTCFSVFLPNRPPPRPAESRT